MTKKFYCTSADGSCAEFRSNEFGELILETSDKERVQKVHIIFTPADAIAFAKRIRKLAKRAIGEEPKEDKPAEPLPCPICGSEVEMIDSCVARWLACKNTDCRLVGPYGKDEQEAIYKWNRLSYDNLT